MPKPSTRWLGGRSVETSDSENDSVLSRLAGSKSKRQRARSSQKSKRGSGLEVADSEAESSTASSGAESVGQIHARGDVRVPVPRRVVSARSRMLDLDFSSDRESASSAASGISYNHCIRRSTRKATGKTQWRIRRSLMALEAVADTIDGRHCTETPPTVMDSSDECRDNERNDMELPFRTPHDNSQPLHDNPPPLHDNPRPLHDNPPPFVVYDDGLHSSDPRSSVWKGRQCFNLAVVVLSPDISTRDNNATQSRYQKSHGSCTVARVAGMKERDFEFDDSEHDTGTLQHSNKMPPKRLKVADSDGSPDPGDSSDHPKPPPKKRQRTTGGTTKSKARARKPAKNSTSVMAKSSEESEHEEYMDDEPSASEDTTAVDGGEIESPWDDAEPVYPEPKKKKKRVSKKSTKPEKEDDDEWRMGFDLDLPPLKEVHEFFSDMITKAMPFLELFLKRVGGRNVRVGTMCSGTESPMMFLNFFSKFLEDCPEITGSLRFDHRFAFEIVPFKQGYIQTNFDPAVLFRDMLDMKRGNLDDGKLFATTAFGKKAEVEGHIDILIAGTCCVDFSNLNTNKKTIEEGGESGDTFLALIFYCKQKHPYIVICENVQGAPWTQEKTNPKNFRDENDPGNRKDAFDENMRKIGYFSMHTSLDSKNFYLPQTRVRGYMVCVWSGRPEITRAELARWRRKIGQQWVNTIQVLQRPASVPFDAIMLDPSDPRIIRAATDAEGAISHAKWDACYVRHQHIRHENGYGNLHPITDLVKGGATILPDNFTPAMARLGERVSDLQDITHIRAAVRGYDQNYQSRVIDVSQNIDMQAADTHASGIIGCITPNGLPVSTTRYGLVVPAEVWKAQGLDIDRLDLRRLTARNMRDMAGNAMASTVVGTVLLSALISFGYDLELRELSESPVPNFDDYEFEGENTLDKTLTNPFAYSVISRQDAISGAETTRRRCLCENQNNIVNRPLQICEICGHGTHVSCGLKPKHSYVPISHEVRTARQEPFLYATFLNASLPKMVKFSHDLKRFFRDNRYDIDEKTWDMIRPAVANALSSQPWLEKIERNEIWTVTYRSNHARLILEISGHDVLWTLYAEPDKNLPGNDPVRQQLLLPIARMEVSDSDIMKGQWSFWAPQQKSFEGTMSSSGEWEPSWMSSLGLLDKSNDVVPSGYCLTIPDWDARAYGFDLNGSYKLSADCGMAKNSLHVHQESRGELNPMFLFLDHDPINNPALNKFVFSQDRRRYQWPEKRPVVATMGNLWRQPEVNSSAVDEGTVELNHTVDIQVAGKWAPMKLDFDLSRDFEVENFQLGQNPKFRAERHPCDVSHAALVCVSNLPPDAIPNFSPDRWHKLDTASEKDVLKPFSWLLGCSKVIAGHRENDDNWHPVASTGHICRRCAPQAPSILWKYNEDRQVPYEDPSETDRYERELKAVPHGIAADYQFRSGDLDLTFRIGINPLTLCHQAEAILLQKLEPTSPSDASLSWRLVTDEESLAKPPKTSLTLRSTSDVVPNLDMPDLVKILPRREQLQEVQWMVNQENDPPEFDIEEVVEARLPALGYRLEGKATRKTAVRGGISASEVGFGKTAIIYWLLACQLTNDLVNSLKHVKGAITVKATVVFVPPHITSQWGDEGSKFLDIVITVIATSKQLADLTVEDVENSHVIIVNWKLLEGESYRFRVAEVAGLVEPDEKVTQRALGTWHERARESIADNVEHLRDDPEGISKYVHSKLEAHKMESQSETIPVPSKRVRGAKYLANKTQSAAAKNTKGVKAKDLKLKARKADLFELENAESNANSWKKAKGVVFEMFRFARIVVDEYTYLSKKAAPQAEAIILNLNSHCRWALSGTPPMSNLQDIKSVVRWIKLDVGRTSLASMNSDQIKQHQKDFTSVELFLSHLADTSDAHKRRDDEIAQLVCDLFVRRNTPQIDAITVARHLIEISQSPSERASYLESVSHFAAANFNIKAIKKAHGTGSSRDAQIKEELNPCDDCEQALILRAGIDTSHEQLLPVLEQYNGSLSQAASHVRVQEYNESFKELEYYLRKANWLRHHSENQSFPIYNSWKDRVKSNIFGDLEVTNKMIEVIEIVEATLSREDWKDFYYKEGSKEHQDNITAEAPNAPSRLTRKTKKTRNSSDDEDQEAVEPEEEDEDEEEEDEGEVAKSWQQRTPYPRGKSDRKQYQKLDAKHVELRQTLTRLTTLVQQLVTKMRAARFFQRLATITGDLPGFKVNCEGKDCPLEHLDHSQVILSVPCGHLLCSSRCMKTGVDVCPVKGCDTVIKPFQKTSMEYLGTAIHKDIVPSMVSGTYHGQKIEVLASIIQDLQNSQPIKKSTGGILLFVQFANLQDAVSQGLRSKGIGVTSLRNENKSSEALKEWQNGVDNSPVLLLSMGDATAAGSNLTRANHIIFYAPYHIKGSNSQALYEDQKRQAIGRADRHGQKHDVHVYDLLSTNTIDVDILQMRSKKILKHVHAINEPRPYPSFVPSGLALVDAVKGEQGHFTSVASTLVFPRAND